MNSDHSINEIGKYYVQKRKPIYLLRIGSYYIYDSLVELGLTPKKSKNMKFPDIPEKYLGSFVRGYFDGDVCVSLEKAKGSGDFKRLRIIFTSGSKLFLLNYLKNFI